jgi:hypothetical protein
MEWTAHCTSYVSEPIATTRRDHPGQPHACRQDHVRRGEVAVLPLQFRYVLEVHAGNRRQDRDDGKPRRGGAAAAIMGATYPASRRRRRGHHGRDISSQQAAPPRPSWARRIQPAGGLTAFAQDEGSFFAPSNLQLAP